MTTYTHQLTIAQLQAEPQIVEIDTNPFRHIEGDITLQLIGVNEQPINATAGELKLAISPTRTHFREVLNGTVNAIDIKTQAANYAQPHWAGAARYLQVSMPVTITGAHSIKLFVCRG